MRNAVLLKADFDDARQSQYMENTQYEEIEETK